MTHPHVVAVTRRLPTACEARLQAHYNVRLGDDDARYTAQSLAAHAKGASALIVTPAERLDAAAISALPDSVWVLSTFSVGFEHIDLEAARARGLRVTNTPGVLTEATADLAMLLILGATRRAGEAERLLRRGEWKGLRPTWMLGQQLTGKRLGIVGMGAIGAATAARARAFGMRILYHNRSPAPQAGALDATYCRTLDKLLPQSDVLSLHCPLTKSTANLLDRDRLALLPEGAVVVNTARGGLVDDEALIQALVSSRISAAGLDVFAGEPDIDPRYRTLEQVFMLPHLGSATHETRTAMGMLAIDNVEAVLAGRAPPHALV